MEGVLNQVLGSHKENKVILKAQTNILSKILNVQEDILQEEKERNKQAKREKQAKDREKADTKQKDNVLKKILKELSKDKGGKEKKKGIFGKLLDALGGLLGKGGLLKALGLTGLGAGILAYFTNPEFRKFVNDTIGALLGDVFSKENMNKMMQGLTDFFFKDAQWKKDFRKGFVEFFTEDAPWKKDFRKGLSDFFVKDAPWKEEVRKGFINLLNGLGDILNSFGDALRNLPGIKQIFDAVDNTSKAMKSGVNNTREFFGLANDNSLTEMERQRQQSLITQNIRTQTNPFASDAEKNKARVDLETQNKLVKTAEELQQLLFDKDRKQKQIDDNKGLSGRDKQRLTRDKSKLKDIEEDIKDARKRLKTLRNLQSDIKYQTGGFVGRVPNQGGNGDRFRTMVAPGSVVLNQTAAGFQSGGMVPVILEQGEHVFGPRDPMAGAALMMNSMIPRFQTGGVVATDGVSDTGAGYQPNGQKDYKGRPVVFSKAAAEAWASFGNNVRGQDVNSSKRSPAKNRAVGGVPNSNHLYGTGVDVQTGSPSWHFLKENDGKAGWKFNNYLGPQGWHWDFKGAGMNITPKEGNENGIAKISTQEPNAFAQFMSTLMPGQQPTGMGAKELGAGFKSVLDAFSPVLNPLMDILGDFAGLALGGLGGFARWLGGGSNAMFNPMAGGPSDIGMDSLYTGTATALSGDTQSKAKEMFDYIVGKGYSQAQAKGIVANIQRESNFDPKVASGDDGGAGGLFQWKGSRQTSTVQKLVKDGNWKGQIDYALQEDVGPQYKSATAGMNAREAAYWWMDKWERPADRAAGDRKHADFLKSYQFQNGGVANMNGKSSMNTRNMVAKSQEQFAQMIAQAIQPVVVPVPMGGGGGGTKRDNSETAGTPFPSLPAEDNSVVSMEYKYRITMGASV